MNIKKTVLRMVPYECIALYGTKIGQAWRLAAGTGGAREGLHLGEGFLPGVAAAPPRFFPPGGGVGGRGAGGGFSGGGV